MRRGSAQRRTAARSSCPRRRGTHSPDEPGRDLGLHRLKDLGAPERLFQLGWDRFPSLRSLNATNLPAQLDPLVGRSEELREIGGLIDTARVVT